mmetsp:Transcript_12472/g.37015  ORF Transcript_12472/g.37015 Transcript_12472/m.37015 type:complete len:325 (+) Transcript_12472:649-1623(+)
MRRCCSCCALALSSRSCCRCRASCCAASCALLLASLCLRRRASVSSLTRWSLASPWASESLRTETIDLPWLCSIIWLRSSSSSCRSMWRCCRCSSIRWRSSSRSCCCSRRRSCSYHMRCLTSCSVSSSCLRASSRPWRSFSRYTCSISEYACTCLSGGASSRSGCPCVCSSGSQLAARGGLGGHWAPTTTAVTPASAGPVASRQESTFTAVGGCLCAAVVGACLPLESRSALESRSGRPGCVNGVGLLRGDVLPPTPRGETAEANMADLGLLIATLCAACLGWPRAGSPRAPREVLHLLSSITARLLCHGAGCRARGRGDDPSP